MGLLCEHRQYILFEGSECHFEKTHVAVPETVMLYSCRQNRNVTIISQFDRKFSAPLKKIKLFNSIEQVLIKQAGLF